MISQRARSIDTSGIRRVFDLASGLKDPVNLSIGMPAFDALDPIRENVKRAVDSRKGGYSVTQGIPELRDEVRRKYGVGPGSAREDLDVVITAGTSGGFFLAYMAMLDAGDEVLIPDPFFGMYRDSARLLGTTPVFFDIYPDFRPTVARIEPYVTPKTKVIIVNNPGNPTGAVLSQSEVNEVLEFAASKGIWIIYDEIYSEFTLDQEPASVLGRYERTVILNGLSKSHGIPGWRLGWAVGPKEIIGEMIKMQQYTYVCAPTLVQYGALETIDFDFSKIRADYRKKRDTIYDGLKDKYEMERPGGAYYAFPRAPGGEAQKFLERCIEKSLLIVPGNVFSRRDTHFRISFSAPQEALERGVEILRALA